MKDEFLKCRICCLQTDQNCSLQPIQGYKDKLNYATGTVILLDQPQNICDKCVEELEISFNFKRKCEQADTFYTQTIIKCEAIDFVVEKKTLPDEPLVDDCADNDSENVTEDKPAAFDLPEIESTKNTKPKFENPQNTDKDVKKGFKRKRTYERFIDDDIACEECGKKYNNGDSLRHHYRRKHNNKKAYSCRKCLRKFYTKIQNEKHESKCLIDSSKPKESLENENTSFCPYCGKIMGSSYLTRHIKDLHESLKNKDQEYICDLCGEKYKSRAGILNHVRNVHLNFKHRCCFCNEAFPSIAVKRNHEIVFHTFKYKYECIICKHKFIVHRDYQRHLTTHTGEKNHMCSICGKRLSRKYLLDEHMATHSDARPHSCSVCTASFKTKKSLKFHQLVHEERKYECPVCQQQFLVNQALRQHVQKRHPEFELPPPGTIMNKRALQRIEEVSAKYNVRVNAASVRPLQSQKDAKEGETINTMPIINSNFLKKTANAKKSISTERTS